MGIYQGDVYVTLKPIDEWTDEGRPDGWVRPWQRRTNNSGGFEGGMTTGEPIVCRFTIKPIPTLHHPLPSVDLITGELVNAHYERSDVCVVPAAGVIGESMVAACLADAMLEKFGGDSVEEEWIENHVVSRGKLGIKAAKGIDIGATHVGRRVRVSNVFTMDAKRFCRCRNVFPIVFHGIPLYIG